MVSDGYRTWVLSLVAQTPTSSLIPAVGDDAQHIDVAAAVHATKVVRQKALFDFDAELDAAMTRQASIGWCSICLKIEDSAVSIDGKTVISLKSANAYPWMLNSAHTQFEASVLGCHIKKRSDAHFQVTFIPNTHCNPFFYASTMSLSWNEPAHAAIQSSTDRRQGVFHEAVGKNIVDQQLAALLENSLTTDLPKPARDLIGSYCADAAHYAFLNNRRLTSLSTAGRATQFSRLDQELQNAMMQVARLGYSGLTASLADTYKMQVNETNQLLQLFELWMVETDEEHREEDTSRTFLELHLAGKQFQSVFVSKQSLKLSWEC